MARPRQDPNSTASLVLSVRLTPLEAAAVERMVQLQNSHLEKLGFPPAITGASFLKSLVVRLARAEGLLPGGPTEAIKGPPLEVHPPRIRSDRNMPPLPPATLWEWIGSSHNEDNEDNLPLVPKALKVGKKKSVWDWIGSEEDPLRPAGASAKTKKSKSKRSER